MAADSARSDDAARQVSAPVVRNIVRRTRLFAALDRVQTTPGLLVCGPAGYGKSLLVASWWRERAFPYAAWVNLSFTRSSPGQTWAALVGAIRTTVTIPDAELDSLEALAFTAPQDLPARLGHWLTQQDHDTYLVVDELHTVTGIGIHEQLVELIAAAAARLRLVAITRHDPLWPLHRMRLDGLLCDLRAEDLAFDDVEAAELFSSLGLAVSAERIHQVVVTTQGWAAGLRLAAIGATATDDPDAYLATISGRNRYIADYLLREVFERLGAEWQDFLGRIGVVDEISPELAIALGCGADSGARLAELARRNAFTHQIGDRLGWYRLHPLLLDFLRSRATDESQRRTLHGRAARWFEEQGEPRLAALEELEEALVVAAPQLLRQPFLARRSMVAGLLGTRLELGTREPSFAADLLDRTAEQGPRASMKPNAIFVPLTARELNILRYLATTMTGQEIAQTLYVSINTVKTHQRSIHRKLGANDRREAVARARALGLL